MNAAERWRRDLESWAIPEEILAQAPESPWIHPPVLFDVPEGIEENPSHQRAREALVDGGSVLDVGCGGGVAAFALTPPAALVVGVDHQAAMLEMFTANAQRRGVQSQTHLGFWPAVASSTPTCDVAVAHHVVYNVGDIVPFLREMDLHARRRVVLEMPRHHPLASLSPAWQHFWGLSRPTAPEPHDLVEVLAAMGITAHREDFEGSMSTEMDLASAAHFDRIRLCLPAAREDEVLAFLHEHPPTRVRELSVVWWDVAR